MKKIILLFLGIGILSQTILAQNQIQQYEFWIDTNYAGKQITNVAATQHLDLNANLSNASLTNGLHTLNFRFKDDSSKYSSVLSQMIEAFTASPQIQGYEYWFDDAFTNKIFVPITPSTSYFLNLSNIDASALHDGMHFFNIRFKDLASQWSLTENQIFYKAGNSSQILNTIAGYRYWIDSTFANQVYKSLSNASPYADINETIDLSSFSNGNKIIHVQCTDEMGLWSSVISDTITIAVGTQNNIAKSNGISIYPNPNSGVFQISNLSDMERYDILIANTLGEMVFAEYNQNISNKSIDVSNLPSGIYFLKTMNKKYNFSQKIQLQR